MRIVDNPPSPRYLEGVSHRIVIIGASYAGMCSALALCSKGLGVRIVERAETPGRRGSGVVVQSRMEEQLKQNGLESRGVIGISPSGRRLFKRDGSVAELPLDGAYYTGWDALLSRLEASLPRNCILRGLTLQDVDVQPDHVVARFHTGEEWVSDVLVGADGIGSRTRQIVDPDAVPEFAGYVAYRGVVSESAIPSDYRDGMDSYFNIVELPRGQFLSYPISGPNGETAEGRRRINWVWYVPESQDAPESFRDRQGVLHRSTVAPGLVRQDVREHILGIARRDFPLQFYRLVAATEEPFIQRVVDMMPRKMVFGRAVLVGDAASIVRPHTGSGSAKAVEDAVLLAEHLSETPHLSDCNAVQNHLAAWEAERLASNRALVERGRALASEFGIDE